MLSRLKTGRGETLVETLVALLISAISLIMFAQMLSPAVNLTKTGRGWNADVNKLNTILEKKDGISVISGFSVTSGAGKFSISIVSGGATLVDNTDVTLYVTNYDGREPVISYGIQNNNP